jgi:hypothetical protein
MHKRRKKTKNVSNNMLDILQKYVFEMQGNDMLPMKYKKNKKIVYYQIKIPDRKYTISKYQKKHKS